MGAWVDRWVRGWVSIISSLTSSSVSSNNLIKQCLLEAQSFDHFKVYDRQCSELRRQLSVKLAKFWSVKTETHTATKFCFWTRQTHSTVIESPADYSQYLEQCPQALKEVHRVLKHALSFLRDCSGELWLRTALYKADTREALLVHIHDLLWCVVGLDVALHLAKGDSMETCSDLAARRMRDCSREMELLADNTAEHAADLEQLLTDLHRLVDEDPCNINPWNTRKDLCQLSHNLIRTLEDNSAKPCFLEGRTELVRFLVWDDLVVVRIASWLGLDVACKSFTTNYDMRREREMRACKFRDPFIVRTFGIEAQPVWSSVMELFHQDLWELIGSRMVQSVDERRGPFSLPAAVDIMVQISRGMEYLHEQGVIHQDIKPGNILVNPCEVEELYQEEGYVTVKICDFGTSQFGWQDKVQTAGGLRASNIDPVFSTGRMGTGFYRAPEVLLPGSSEDDSDDEYEYSLKADVYSFAMVCSEILTGQSPFQGLLLAAREAYRLIADRGQRPELIPSCPSFLSGFINRCWDTDPEKRPHFREITKFLLHVKLVLMRLDGPTADFMSVLTEYDRMELERHLHPSPEESLEAEESLQAELEEDEEEEEDEEDEEEEVESFLRGLRNYQPLDELPNFIVRMSMTDLSEATNDFSRENRIGKGGYASVFKGSLPDGREVAVKRLSVSPLMFGTEARASAKVLHPNVIRLVGLCDEEGWRKFLVYEYMARGSLGKYLFPTSGPSPLKWRMRCKIALGVARGLAYLHEDLDVRILHFDVKADNIVLDPKWEPKVCDFGISELVGKTQTFTSHEKMGTRGYTPPELNVCDEEGKVVTDRADVYSFGMLLFEMVRGIRNYEMVGNPPWKEFDPWEGKKMVEEGRVMDLLDPVLAGEAPAQEEVEEFVRIALLCTCAENQESRPPMQKVVGLLNRCQ